jgi:hypothetical protein
MFFLVRETQAGGGKTSQMDGWILFYLWGDIADLVPTPRVRFLDWVARV